MVLKLNDQLITPIVKWIGAHNPHLSVPHLQHKNVLFYAKCIIGPLTLSVGDFVLVSNADAADPDSVEGCDIAKILNLYDLREMSTRDPYRAIVQWYSRPQCIPHKHFDCDDICIDFETEVVEDYRPYDRDISLETVFRKCSVISGPIEISASGLLAKIKEKGKRCTMFVCRYKFIKVKKSYRLVPLQFANDEATPRTAIKSTGKTTNMETNFFSKQSMHSTLSSSKETSLPSGADSMEFIDIGYFNAENKVSPIKIIGGRSVVRLSASKKNKSVEQNNINNNNLFISPLGEQNVKITPRSKAATARRNLNLSLETSEGDNNRQYDCPNYSIIKSASDPEEPRNVKIKLKLSERRRSARLTSFDEYPPVSLDHNAQEHSANGDRYNSSDIYQTPTKKSKESAGTSSLNRTKSILKSASTRMEGTPKRSIQLSSIVEKHIFDGNEIISTPKSTKARKSLSAVVESNKRLSADQPTPKKCKQKTPIKNITMASNEEILTRTPSEKLKMIRSGEIKPKLENRSGLPEAKNKTDLQIACERLHVSVVPKFLPCREREFENIYTFLQSKIQDQCGGCIYVSGVPGTGKTATVTGVINSLQKKASEDELSSFDFLEINGMRLTEPRQAYVYIYKQLTGKTLSWEHALALLEKRFTTPAPRRVTTVLLVDELDILCNRRQDVVYNLLDWPTKAAARLVVITIANTMDLPERLLMGKVTSRLGLTRLTFQPYSHKQLQEIVLGRLRGSEAFKGDAVELVARKVAAVSGDARRALDICRRATEIADVDMIGSNAAQRVNMLHVQQALGEMISSAKVQAIKNCSRLEQIFLQAVVAEVNRTGVEETSFSGVYSQIETITAFMGVSTPTPGRALHICSKLGAERLLICEHSRNDIFQKILLNVSTDDVHYALKVNN